MFLTLEQHTDPLDGGDARVTFETLGDRLPSFGAKSTLRHAEENGVDAVVQQSDRNQTPFDGDCGNPLQIQERLIDFETIRDAFDSFQTKIVIRCYPTREGPNTLSE